MADDGAVEAPVNASVVLLRDLNGVVAVGKVAKIDTALRLGEVRRELRLMEPEGQVVAQHPAAGDSLCCRRYHRAVEMIGKRWTGAILRASLRLVSAKAASSFCARSAAIR